MGKTWTIPPASSSSNDSLMDSLRSIRANLHGGQLRTMVDKFKTPQIISRQRA